MNEMNQDLLKKIMIILRIVIITMIKQQKT